MGGLFDCSIEQASFLVSVLNADPFPGPIQSDIAQAETQASRISLLGSVTFFPCGHTTIAGFLAI